MKHLFINKIIFFIGFIPLFGIIKPIILKEEVPDYYIGYQLLLSSTFIAALIVFFA